MTDFGSGIFLGPEFDFTVDTTGDLRSEDGVQELQKDLAFNMASGLQDFIGRPSVGTLKTEIKDRAKRIAEADERIRFVADGSFDIEIDESRQQIGLEMTVITDVGEQRLVFNI